MRREALVGVGATSLALAACAGFASPRDDVRVLFEDNVGGASGVRISPLGDTVRVQVAEFATDCRLQQFLIGPRGSEQHAAGAPGLRLLNIRPPDEVRDGKAILNMFSPGDWIVRAQYVHTTLADEGQKVEPEGEARAWGEGDLQVGRLLAGGYRFDHVEFASHVTGPGGASARVTRYPNPGAEETTMSIHWYYDRYSKVDFNWKVYARGPCDARP